MERYSNIDTRNWNDAKYMALSERAKLVFLFGLTHPNMKMLGASGVASKQSEILVRIPSGEVI